MKISPVSRRRLVSLAWTGTASAVFAGCVTGASHSARTERPPAYAQRAVASGQSCLPGPGETATSDTINAHLLHDEAVIDLCPDTVFRLSSPVIFQADHQVLQTAGLPTDLHRAVLLVNDPSLGTAIKQVRSLSGLQIKNVVINGNAENLPAAQPLGASPGLGYKDGAGGLIELGGDVNPAPLISFVAAGNPRGWTSLHITEGSTKTGCTGAVIADSEIGPAGRNGGGEKKWADGISLSCSHSRIERNRVHNATDGGIVIFGGAIGTQVLNNVIVADDSTVQGAARAQFGGINLVDYAPHEGDFSQVLVSGNHIQGFGSQIKVAIAAGFQVWGCDTSHRVTGATIRDNTLEGKLGYGIVVNGAQDFTVTANHSTASFGGTPHAECGNLLKSNTAPAALVVDTSTSPGTNFSGNDFPAVTGNVRVNHAIGIDQIPVGTTPIAALPPTHPVAGSADAVMYAWDEPRLKSFHSACASTDPASTFCASAFHRSCQALGYTSGFAPVEYASGVWTGACLSAKLARVTTDSTAVLHSFDAGCDIARPASGECRAAYNRSCGHIGFEGGFGPVEYANDQITYTCVAATPAVASMTAKFGALKANHAGCAGNDHALEGACFAAYSRYCVAQGYLTGFGPVEHDGAGATFTCVK